MLNHYVSLWSTSVITNLFIFQPNKTNKQKTKKQVADGMNALHTSQDTKQAAAKNKSEVLGKKLSSQTAACLSSHAAPALKYV